ncbi:MAG: thiamine phosphate synthase [Eggerthellaceae bacterium]|nr:thiamine phosphate synthase [Eggerthellaceae bacterium]
MTWTSEELRRSMLLYAVTDGSWLNGRSLDRCVSLALAGGATFVQLREKDATSAQRTEMARKLVPLCRRAGVPFVVNDDVEAALASGADGVHVGQSDAACADARAVLGPNALVGVSVQTVEQALAAERAGASYLGVGALFGTPTKPDAQLVTIEELRSICEAVSIPVVGIGGLNLQTMDALRNTGVDGAAVVSAVFAADDIEFATRQLRDTMKDVVDG